MKIPISFHPCYTAYLEWFSGRFWFHVDVVKWSPEVKKDLLNDLKLMRELVKMPINAMVETENLFLRKFGKVTGWIVESKHTLKDGTDALIYRWG